MTPAAERLLARAVDLYPKGIRGSMTPEQVERFRAIVDRMVDISQEDAPEHNWCPLSMFMSDERPRLADALVQEFLGTKAFAAALDALGGRVVVLMRHSIVRRRDVGVVADRSPWHLDVDFMGIEGEMLNVWIPLVDVGTGHSGLTFIMDRDATARAWSAWLDWAGEHWSSVKRTSAGDLIGDEARLREILGVEPDTIARTPLLKAGDALLFNQAVLHRTQDPTGAPGPRHSIEMRLAAPDDLPQTYRSDPLPVALVSVSGGRASVRFMPSDRLAGA